MRLFSLFARSTGRCTVYRVDNLGHDLNYLIKRFHQCAQPCSFGAVKRLDITDSKKARSLRRRRSRVSISPDEFDLRRDKQRQLRAWRKLLPPWRRRAIWHKRNAMAMRKELFKPRDKSIAATEWWVHPDKSGPLETKTIFRNVPISWYPRNNGFARACNIHVEFAPQRIEDMRRRVPLIRCANALLVKCHLFSLSTR